MSTHVILVTPLEGAALDGLLDTLGAPGIDVTLVRKLEDLATAPISESTTLICFGTGIIVPPEVLNRLSRPGYNFHGATPHYPGRDPHHFAIYDGAREYGATAHMLANRVDSGPIVGVELFPVSDECKAEQLLGLANEAALRLFQRLVPAMLSKDPLPALTHIRWGSCKSTRRDFLAMCEISPAIAPEEFERRFHAFDGGRHDNLTVRIHGWTFRIDKTVPRYHKEDDSAWTEFTEASYQKMLGMAIDSGYVLVPFGAAPPQRHVFWRHDIDFSVHRAARLAEIEAELGVQTTYFVNPHCVFYNMLEPEILGLLRRIRSLGHNIGLHFDADAYHDEPWTRDKLESRLLHERMLVRQALDCPVEVFSYHNPDVGGLLSFNDDQLAGMTNIYSSRLRANYVYASDSNGYWRFKSIPDTIRDKPERLHILTHPEWWTSEPLAPRDRIERCVMGRARANMQNYDAGLARFGRPNLSKDANRP